MKEYSLSCIIIPNNYLALTNILISSFKNNPYYFLTYLGVPEEISKAYHLATLIKFDEESVQTIKVVHNQTKTIVAFATWFIGPKPQNKTPNPPDGSTFAFLNDIKKRVGQVANGIYNEDTDWSKF